MPPPPVAGAAVTTGVGDTVAVGVGVGVAVRVTVAVGVALAVGVAVAVELAGTELLAVGVGWTEPLAVGRNVVADAEGVDDDVQPDTAAEPRTVMAPKPTAVSNARGVCTLLRYPAGQP